MTDHEQVILNAWNQFVLQHSKSAAGKGTTGKPGMVIEAKRGILYQRCVRAGLKPQLKRKYRGLNG